MTEQIRSRLLAVLVAVAAFAGLACWAVSSPVGSAPDDDFHMASLWCPTPLATSGCTVYEENDEIVGVWLPELVAKPNCFAFQPKVAASCQDELSRTQLVVTKRVDRGDYPGPYYRIMHAFVGPDIERSVLSIRIFNAALAVVLIGAAVALTQPRLRPGLAWALSASVVPAAMFLVPSDNPSSWAFSGLTCFWISCFALARSRSDRHAIASAVLAVVGVVVALLARNDSVIYALVGLAATAVLYAPLPFLGRPVPPRSSSRLPGWAPWVLVAFTVLSVGFWSFTSARSSTGILPDDHRATRDFWGVLINNLLESLQVPAGLLGFAQLGWNDVHPPGIVSVTSLGICCFVLMTGLRELSVRKLLALIGVGGTLVLLPIVMLQRALAFVGDQVQSRYFISLLPLLIAVALMSGDARRALRFGRVQALFAWAGLSVANAVMLYINLRRYTVGSTGTYVLGVNSVDWWWRSGPAPVVVVLLGAAGFAAATAVLVLASGGTALRRDLAETSATID